MALSAVISSSVPSAEVIEKLYDNGTIHFLDVKDSIKKDGARIFVDGKLIGYHQDGEKLANSLRELRRSSALHPHIGISIHQPEQ